jgi:hypothetical protein
MAELGGRIADGVNLPGGPHLPRLLEVSRRAREASGGDPTGLVVTVSSDLRASTLERLGDLGVDRAVAFVQAPLSDGVHRLAATRRH